MNLTQTPLQILRSYRDLLADGRDRSQLNQAFNKLSEPDRLVLVEMCKAIESRVKQAVEQHENEAIND